MAVLECQHTFAMFDIFSELAEVARPIRINFLSVLVANAIIEVPNQLGAFVRQVASIPGDGGVNELTSVLVSVVEVHDTFALHHSFLKVSFIDPTLVVEC